LAAEAGAAAEAGSLAELGMSCLSGDELWKTSRSAAGGRAASPAASLPMAMSSGDVCSAAGDAAYFCDAGVPASEPSCAVTAAEPPRPARRAGVDAAEREVEPGAMSGDADGCFATMRFARELEEKRGKPGQRFAVQN
jgi:hypothetical protein